MTQTEYENQTEAEPTRKPMGSVVIEKFHTWKQTTIEAGQPVEVRYYNLILWGEPYGPYRTKQGSNVLYTMDDDGNIKSPSCFREPEQESV
jgi:hypothetical protein